ncbi:hypothetical protein [Desulfoscipio gibsoniae]|uniref:hypothetical protein n=1 Tax=Desulfoscipio gibsoniae TaxID=102134 RepID=UPI00059B8C1F|nr:hypothetical protein [Desulfoscipio gibsoniae]
MRLFYIQVLSNAGSMILAQYLWKVSYEIAAIPLTYLLVRWVKHKEGLDMFDYGVRYNPFNLEV